MKSLCLGAESDVLRDYQESNQNSLLRRQEYVDTLVDSLDPHDDDEDQDYSPWLMLQELQLVGLDVCKIIKPASLFLDLHSLTSLTLETCLGLETALDMLATKKNKSGLPLRSGLRLHYFSLRHEASNQQFRARLIDFLSAIQGLTHLLVLLENSDRSRPDDLDPILAVHGQSLRSLVWDERSGKRDLFVPSEETYKPSYLRLATIATHCPNLVELGISMDWRDFTKKGSHDPHSSNRHMTGVAFKPLKNLQTLNIRNMPLVNPKKMALPLSEIHSSFANSLLKILLCSDKDILSPSAPQNLKTLALGALTYRDLHNGTGCHTIPNRDLYEFLRLRMYKVVSSYYGIDRARPKPLAVLTEIGHYEKTEANGGDVNVLKPYWLG
ncbi:MAG: hypothetical protein L6R38_005846 [Xanthoria sp. 2 TBL-2021]|nr:MAG: hypothetical protein L6R38_005846 [Xanthoria sp. 2 TBL-2021]